VVVFLQTTADEGFGKNVLTKRFHSNFGALLCCLKVLFTGDISGY
jgi:hypothetical protein